MSARSPSSPSSSSSSSGASPTSASIPRTSLKRNDRASSLRDLLRPPPRSPPPSSSSPIPDPPRLIRAEPRRSASLRGFLVAPRRQSGGGGALGIRHSICGPSPRPPSVLRRRRGGSDAAGSDLDASDAAGGWVTTSDDERLRASTAARCPSVTSGRTSSTSSSTTFRSSLGSLPPSEQGEEEQGEASPSSDVIDHGNAEAVAVEGTEWACPRCTLLNSPSDDSCVACVFDVGGGRSRVASDTSGVGAGGEGADDDGGAVRGRPIDDGFGGTPPPTESITFDDYFRTIRSSVAVDRADVDRDRLERLRRQQLARQRVAPQHLARQLLAPPRTSSSPEAVSRAGFATTAPAAAATSSSSRRREEFATNEEVPVGASRRRSEYEEMLDALLDGIPGHARPPLLGPRIEDMSYEQLLETFGDGSENRARGAAASAVSNLPVATLRDVERELPEGARSCAICLGDFENGDRRRTLPCLHGFHAECVDRWLRENGCCPVCKHAVS